MKAFSISTAVLATLISVSTALGEPPKPHEDALNPNGGRAEAAEQNSDYACEIVKYESKQSDEKSTVAKFEVPENKDSGFQTTGEGENQVKWKVTRAAGKVVVESRDARGRTMLSTGVDGLPVGVELPHSKNILACNPPENGLDKLCANRTAEKMEEMIRPLRRVEKIKPLDFEPIELKIDPRAYGESIRRFDITPKSYGASMSIHRLPDFDSPVMQRFKELMDRKDNRHYSDILKELKTSDPELHRMLTGQGKEKE